MFGRGKIPRSLRHTATSNQQFFVYQTHLDVQKAIKHNVELVRIIDVTRVKESFLYLNCSMSVNTVSLK